MQRDILKEKEDIERHKRTKKSKRKAENDVGGLDYDFSFDESEYFSKIDPAEQKEILTFKLQLLQREELSLREDLIKLEKEKHIYLTEFKRMKEEETSRYCGAHSKVKNTILKDRYLILSLLGKGGIDGLEECTKKHDDQHADRGRQQTRPGSCCYR